MKQKNTTPKNKKKSKTITFALTKGELKLVENLAAKNTEGNVSAWVRRAALKYRD